MERLATAIVVNWNGGEELLSCLASLQRQSYPALEVVVVDNASSDGSLAAVRARFPGVKVVESEANLGFAGGVNRGVAVAGGEYLCLLNQDAEAEVGWVEALVSCLAAEREVGVAGSKVLYPDGRIQHAGGYLKRPLCLADHYGYGSLDDGANDCPREVEYVTGAALAWRRDVAEWVGPWEEAFWPAYFEDVDFCWRAREKGFRVVYLPGAVAKHRESSSLGRDSAAYYEHYHTNRLRFVLKHCPAAEVLELFCPEERSRTQGVSNPLERAALRSAYLRALLEAERPSQREGPEELALALWELWRLAASSIPAMRGEVGAH